MNNSKKIYEDIIRIISEVTAESIDNLNLNTTINLDLMIYGDDWDDLMKPILEKYRINEHSAFIYSKHMRPEGDEIGPLLLEIILTIPKYIIAGLVFPFNKQKSMKISKYTIMGSLKYSNEPLYIADIFNSVLKKKWEYAKDSNLKLEELVK